MIGVLKIRSLQSYFETLKFFVQTLKKLIKVVSLFKDSHELLNHISPASYRHSPVFCWVFEGMEDTKHKK